MTLSSHVGELQYAPHHRLRAVGLPELVAGRVPGRTGADQIRLADLCGLGVEDAAMADLEMGWLG